MIFYTFPQIRARLAHTAFRSLSRDEIVKRLAALGGKTSDQERRTTRQLAYRLAFCLLPVMSNAESGR